MNQHYQSSRTDSEQRGSEILLQFAQPDIYRNNAFRVLQVPVTASARELSTRLRKLEIMEKLENAEQEAHSILPLTQPIEGDARREAAQRLNDPESRLVNELFWFWPLRLDMLEEKDEALDVLSRGELWDAVSIWNSHEVEGSEANVSVHNLAVMFHALALDLEHSKTGRSLSKKEVEQKRDYWKQAFTKWHILLNDDRFWQRVMDRIRELDDPRLTISTAYGLREGLPLALLSINATLAVRAAQKGNNEDASYHSRLMRESGFDRSVVYGAMRRAATPIRDRLKIICTNAEGKIDKAPKYADKVARTMINQTSEPLSTLDILLPKAHPTREAAHDDVALLILRSQIAFANETEKWPISLRLLKQAKQIAMSASMQRRIEENIKTVREILLHTTCWFCRKRPAHSTSAAEVMMYREVDRVGSWFSTKVYWQQVTLTVPRCSRCKSVHTTRKPVGCLVGILIGLGVLVVCYASGITNWLIILVSAGVCSVIGYGIGSALSRPTRGIKPENAKNAFPRVRQLLSEGWQLGEKPPGVD